MPRAIVGEIELEYETIGAQDDPAILLVTVSYTHLTLPTIYSV